MKNQWSQEIRLVYLAPLSCPWKEEIPWPAWHKSSLSAVMATVSHIHSRDIFLSSCCGSKTILVMTEAVNRGKQIQNSASWGSLQILSNLTTTLQIRCCYPQFLMKMLSAAELKWFSHDLQNVGGRPPGVWTLNVVGEQNPCSFY